MTIFFSFVINPIKPILSPKKDANLTEMEKLSKSFLADAFLRRRNELSLVRKNFTTSNALSPSFSRVERKEGCITRKRWKEWSLILTNISKMKSDVSLKYISFKRTFRFKTRCLLSRNYAFITFTDRFAEIRIY